MTKGKTKHGGIPLIQLLEDYSGQFITPETLQQLAIRCFLNGDLPNGTVSTKKVFFMKNIGAIQHWLFIYVPNLSNEKMIELGTSYPPLGEPLWTAPKRNDTNLEAPLVDFGRCRFSKLGIKEQLKKKPVVDVTLESLVHPRPLLDYIGYPATGLQLDALPGSNKAIALDCEMCLAGTERILTRVAFVDFESEEVIYDTLVQPAKPITDYLTPYSGITAEMLVGVTTTLEDVQEWTRSTFGAADILIGHSLESDLSVLGICHHRCVDTGLLYPHVKGLPMRQSLKYLSKTHLDMDIQGAPTAEVLGHSPIEDALACVKLVKVKIELGADFGNTSRSIPLTKVLSDRDIKSTIVGSIMPYWDAYGTASVITAYGDNAVIKQGLKSFSNSRFVFLTIEGKDASEVASMLESLTAEAPPYTLLEVWNGSGDTAQLSELLQKRRLAKRDLDLKNPDESQNLWTDADEQKLNETKDEARRSISFVTVTPGPESPREGPEIKVRKLNEPEEL